MSIFPTGESVWGKESVFYPRLTGIPITSKHIHVFKYIDKRFRDSMVKVECGFPIQEANTHEGLRWQRNHHHALGGLCVLVTGLLSLQNVLQTISSLSLGQQAWEVELSGGGSREAIGLPFKQVPVCKSK